MDENGTKLHQLLLDSPAGETTDSLQLAFPEWTPAFLTDTINLLSDLQYVEYLILPENKGMLLRARSSADATKFRDMTEHDRLVYQIVRESANKGTWLKTLKDKSGLHSKIVTDCINRMEKKQYIKAIKSVKVIRPI